MPKRQSRPTVFITAAQASIRAGFSRPDAFVRSWLRAGYAVYKRPSGRNLVSLADFESFIAPEAAVDRTE